VGREVPADDDEEGVVLEGVLVLLAVDSVVGEEEAVGGRDGDGARKHQVLVSDSRDLVDSHCSLAGSQHSDHRHNLKPISHLTIYNKKPITHHI
jgi:hypothetical protein